MSRASLAKRSCRRTLLVLLPFALWACAAASEPSAPSAPHAPAPHYLGAFCQYYDVVQGQVTMSCAAVWSPDGTQAYVVAELDTTTPPNPAYGAAPFLIRIDPGFATYSKLASVPGTSAIAWVGNTLVYYVAAGALMEIPSQGGTPTLLSNATGLVSPDGRLMIIHAAGSNRTAASDTLVALDLASGTRRATRVGTVLNALAFSPDGTQVLLAPDSSSASKMVIWHLDTGVQDAGGNFAEYTTILGAAWSRGAFRALVGSPLTSTTVAMREVLVTGGGQVDFPGTALLHGIAWVPDRSAVFISVLGTTYFNDEGKSILDVPASIQYLTASATTTIAETVVQFTDQYNFVPPMPVAYVTGTLSASPSGRWLLLVQGQSSLFVVANPTP